MKVVQLHFPATHPAFAGHFPGAPMVPGALLIAEALAALGATSEHMEIASAKFLRPVGPDTTVEARCEETGAGAQHLELRARGELVATAVLKWAPA